MRRILLAVALSMLAASAHAQGPSCNAQAGEKKLAGAALNSFMKKCEGDSQKRCDAAAKDRKLAGAAKTGYVKKCVSDAVGT